MAKVRVGVAGYGTIGQRLADGVAMQGDMELVGIADLAPTLAIRALRENDMIGANGVKYDLYLVGGADKAKFDALDIPTAGSFEDLCGKVDIMLDLMCDIIKILREIIFCLQRHFPGPVQLCYRFVNLILQFGKIILIALKKNPSSPYIHLFQICSQLFYPSPPFPAP